MIKKIGELSSEWAKAARLDYWYEPTTMSTNQVAKDSAFSEELKESAIAIYFSDHQTQGKGRGTNKWINSKEGSCLLSSWSFYIRNTPAPLLSCFIGLAVYRSLTTTWPFLPWSLKAPNDIYLADKKIGGLLIENLSTNENQHRLIIGFGLNVLSHPSVIENATHLNSFLGAHSIVQMEWFALLDRLLMELSLTISNSLREFTENEKTALLHALNRFPLLTEPYLNIDDHGNIFTPTRKISWYEI